MIRSPRQVTADCELQDTVDDLDIERIARMTRKLYEEFCGKNFEPVSAARFAMTALPEIARKVFTDGN